MGLALFGIIPPKEWYHDSALKESHDYTVAMYLANQGIIPPKEWHH